MSSRSFTPSFQSADINVFPLPSKQYIYTTNQLNPLLPPLHSIQMSVPAPNQPPSPRSSSSTTQQPPTFTPLHGHGHGSLHSESVAGSPLGASLDGGSTKRGSVSIGGSGGQGRRASGVIPSPSGRRGSGSVLTPGGQVVAYHTRTNVSVRGRRRVECDWELMVD